MIKHGTFSNHYERMTLNQAIRLFQQHHQPADPSGTATDPPTVTRHPMQNNHTEQQYAVDANRDETESTQTATRDTARQPWRSNH